MKNLLWFLFLISLVPANVSLASDASANGTAADPDATAKTKALSAARSLCPDYFGKRYQAVGETLKCSLQFENPTAVEGWPGRWRMRGTATLAHYRDPAVDQSLVTREQEIQNNPNLTTRQKKSRIDSLYFIRSEIVEFEVEVSNLDTTPDISMTVR
ncbi:MAG: hypothetical protein QM715_06185 [Nibricoccus sp.]